MTVTELDVKDKPFECVAGRTEFLSGCSMNSSDARTHKKEHFLINLKECYKAGNGVTSDTVSDCQLMLKDACYNR